MMLELLKVLVQPVVLERDENGKSIGEKLGEPTACYDRDQLMKFFDSLEQSVENENRKEEPNAGSRDNGAGDNV
jgi:hypothetical protein